MAELPEIKLHFLGNPKRTACDKLVSSVLIDKFTWSPLAFWKAKDRCKECADVIHVDVEPSRA